MKRSAKKTSRKLSEKENGENKFESHKVCEIISDSK